MLRTAITSLVLIALAALAPLHAHAHFIWLELTPADGDARHARLYFSEEPVPGEPHLIGKVAHSKAWLRDAAGDVRPLKLKAAGDESAALVATCPHDSAVSLEGRCDYGIFDRGNGPMLLQYYAKHLSGNWAADPRLARAGQLKLDIVPEASAGKLVLHLIYDGQLVADNPVVVVDPDGGQHELQTDGRGRAELKAAPGRWAIRAGYTRSDQPGQRDGKSYQQTLHYCTLLLDVPAAAAESPSKLTALAALKRARDGRAIWHGFPGFTAEVTIRGDKREQTGRVTIDADGGVTLAVPDSPLADWAEQLLYSLVQHRMPDGEISTGNVTYADDEADHPLGRKIILDDDQESAYRIKDDVITEVNRSMGASRFTISVLEVVRNAEGKYLPRSFVMSFFDSESGKLEGSLAHNNQWQRVGKYDLPRRTVEIDARQGGSATKEILFENCQLMPGK